MAELGRINPEQRIACPHCRSLLGDDVHERLLEGDELPCPHCTQAIRLPDRAVEEHKRRKYTGINLDITI